MAELNVPPRDAQPSALACLAGGGEMGALMRSIDWSSTPLGPVESWPECLRISVSTCLGSRYPMLIWWGPELVMLYNDAYRPMLGATKHPRAMGRPGRECWSEIWHIIGPMLEGVLARGEATWSEDQALPLERNGYVEECYFTFSYSPIHDPRGRVAGVFSAISEETAKVIGQRRLATLAALAGRAAEGRTFDAACAIALQTLGESRADLPFSLLYRFEAGGGRARLVGAAGVGEDTLARLRELPLDPSAALQLAGAGREGALIDDLAAVLPPLGALELRRAMALPLAGAGQSPYGVLVAGISPRLALDAPYREFYRLVADQVTTAIRNACAYEEEAERARKLAELDRAKTRFFSNVSHELRTPLTLLLGPIEELLSRREGRIEDARPELELAHRNAVRLLDLVNALLDFSRIEAGRMEARYVPTDLAQLTADLASEFRAAMESGGLRYEIDVAPLPGPVFVDREMWERLVLNLLSNAYKFTHTGSVRVSLRAAERDAVLEIIDTGVGIAPDALQRVFERFHRVEGVHARSHEGTGIGLALASELVRMHGGTIEAESQLGEGTTMRVRIPLGVAHLPPERVDARRRNAEPRPRPAARALAPRGGPAPEPAHRDRASDRARVLVVDDNADMREHLERLLEGQWDVLLAADGEQALAAAREHRPDLVLTDVMMPVCDGFELLAALRADPALAATPVIVLSARAGEESRCEGLDAGANDYLVKPFSSRELVARIATQLQLAALRRHAEHERARAERASRAKDEFLAILGHELRNPMAPIVTAVQLMKLRGDERTARERATIERQVEHMLRLLEDLLDLSRLTRGKLALRRTPVELADVVARAIEMTSPLLEARRHRLRVEVPPSGLAVDGDLARLTQVVANLLNNAAKYSGDEGHLAILGAREGEEAVLRVQDDGHGVAPEILPRLFDAFTQERQPIDRAQGGLGLGLAIVRGLVETHGGTVELRSAGVGRGTEVIVRLPALSPALVCAGEPPPPADARPAAGPRLDVLLVDDNTDAVELLAEHLTSLGHTVRVAHDAPSALERIRASAPPDVAVLDIGLPVVDGYELARLLRERVSDLPLVALTGYGQERDVARARAAGFAAHLVKPTKLEALERVLVSVAAGSR